MRNPFSLYKKQHSVWYARFWNKKVEKYTEYRSTSVKVSGKKGRQAETGRSARRINSALSTMRIAVRYAVANEELDRDPFKNIGEMAEQTKEMGILSQEEMGKLIHSPAYPLRHPWYSNDNVVSP